MSIWTAEIRSMMGKPITNHQFAQAMAEEAGFKFIGSPDYAEPGEFDVDVPPDVSTRIVEKGIHTVSVSHGTITINAGSQPEEDS